MEKTKIIRIVIAAVLLAIAYIVERTCALPVWGLLIVYLIPYLTAGYDVLAEAWEGIRHGEPFDEDLLMAVATIGALCIGFLPGAEPQFPEAVFVMLFFQVGELFEDYAEDRSRKSISELMDIRPDTAHRLREDGTEETVAPAEVSVGEKILIRPGEKVPMDGEILDGSSSLDTMALTGESLPRAVKPGDNVISGCVNLSGVLTVRVQKSFGESTASKIIDMVERAGENKSRSEAFITRFAHVYTPVVVITALVLAFIPPFFSAHYGSAFTVWLYRALTFLVVSCPCALVISVPLSFFGGIGGASRRGILIKGGNYMDALAKLRCVVFDKTGTLTQGSFAVQAIHPTLIDERELLRLAAGVERFSTHPVAQALCAAWKERMSKETDTNDSKQDDWQVSQTEELAGRGIRALIGGRTICVGNERLMQETITTPADRQAAASPIPECPDCKRSHTGAAVVHVSIDGEYAGHIVIADSLKADSKEAITLLRKQGVDRTVMLTGDRQSVAAEVAAEVGIDEYHAELLPADKVSRVEALLQAKPAGSTLAFVGDGINDAPVLARADVGIAMGALGSDAAIEAADVVIMDDKPSKIAKAIQLARRTVRNAQENVVFAIIVKIAILILAATGLAGMSLAVFGDVGVMVICVLNATRTLRA